MYNNEAVIKDNKKGVNMGAAKITAMLAGMLNIFIYFFAFIANLDSVKSTILFIVALCMSMYRFYRWMITSWQNKRLKDLAIKEKEIEIEREMLINNEKRVELVERELTVRVTGQIRKPK